jgi:hypothetical protein
MHYVGLATVSPDGEFNPVVLWHPEELKDILPELPDVDRHVASPRALKPWPRPRERPGTTLAAKRLIWRFPVGDTVEPAPHHLSPGLRVEDVLKQKL